jgi:hypothetical protein
MFTSRSPRDPENNMDWSSETARQFTGELCWYRVCTSRPVNRLRFILASSPPILMLSRRPILLSGSTGRRAVCTFLVEKEGISTGVATEESSFWT